jgi:hypothetical protein
MVTRGRFEGEDAEEEKRLAAIGPNPSGLCMCGCGRKTKIVTKSDRRHGHVMGQPFRFIHGHSRPAAKGPNRFKLRRRTAVIFLERRDGTVLECLVSRKDFHKVRDITGTQIRMESGRPTRLLGLTVRKFTPQGSPKSGHIGSPENRP